MPLITAKGLPVHDYVQITADLLSMAAALLSLATTTTTRRRRPGPRSHRRRPR
ncbi:hypothetical protein [Actinoplanes sp. NPDC020271]|uniref:hypothetical protein n=1 Tax=Actinoplanes sp. NPDC020271 TaxID=3363896 RepID=UPI00378A07DB